MDFNYSPFDEDIVIVGGKGRGKTTRLKWVLTQIQNLPYWIWDYQWLLNGFGEIVHTVDELKYGQFILQPYDKGYSNFIKYCNKCYYGAMKGIYKNLIFGVDELHQYVTKQKSCPELYSIVMSARNQGISGIYLSTRPASLPNWILTNADHCFAYGLNAETDIVWLKGYIGEKAWLLVPPDKRKFLKDAEALPKHSCVYRNQTELESHILD